MALYDEKGGKILDLPRGTAEKLAHDEQAKTTLGGPQIAAQDAAGKAAEEGLWAVAKDLWERTPMAVKVVGGLFLGWQLLKATHEVEEIIE